jgi:hypothetical protein
MILFPVEKTKNGPEPPEAVFLKPSRLEGVEQLQSSGHLLQKYRRAMNCS